MLNDTLLTGLYAVADLSTYRSASRQLADGRWRVSVCLSVRLRRQFTARSHTHTHTRTLARRCRGTGSERVARTIRHQIDVGSLATARQQQHQQRCTGSPHSHPLPLTDSASSNTHYFFSLQRSLHNGEGCIHRV